MLGPQHPQRRRPRLSNQQTLCFPQYGHLESSIIAQIEGDAIKGITLKLGMKSPGLFHLCMP